MTHNLYESLVIVSEKAANIARICRQDKHLFALLVEEKGCAETNPRFVRDFKTLADVLIQETVRHDIGKQFPDLRDNIQGEESNAFTNTLGETIHVEVQGSLSDTSKRLQSVLNGDHEAAQVLAKEVHRDVALNEVDFDCPATWKPPEFDISELGIWIDPIDSTAEYISGQEVLGEDEIALSGLKCVTVLIGVYNRSTGVPVLGVINQPFVEFDDINNRWKGRCYWGCDTLSSPSHPYTFPPTNLISISTSEDEDIKKKLETCGYKLVEAAGAGYKILLVIQGVVDAYLLSKDTTYKWDTCGPQAVLKSLGGDLLKFSDAIHKRCVPVEYHKENCSERKVVAYCNYGGILAYRNIEICNKIIDALNR